jgi:hypothetical protein
VLLTGRGNGKVEVTTVPKPSTTVPETPTVPETTAPTVPETTVPTVPDTTAPASGAAGPLCPDAPAATCVATDTGDIDGDGRVDKVAVYYSPLSPGVTPPFPDSVQVTLRVEYAAGTREEVDVTGNPHGIGLLGATDLDGDGREEVAWIYDAGAHSRIGGFVGTTSTGHLHVVGYAEPEVLYDSSIFVAAGFTCPDVDGDGRKELVTITHWDDSTGATTDIDVYTTTYRWDGDRLVKTDEHEETIPRVDADGDSVDDRRGDVRGPHCGDLHYEL